MFYTLQSPPPSTPAAFQPDYLFFPFSQTYVVHLQINSLALRAPEAIVWAFRQFLRPGLLGFPVSEDGASLRRVILLGPSFSASRPLASPLSDGWTGSTPCRPLLPWVRTLLISEQTPSMTFRMARWHGNSSVLFSPFSPLVAQRSIACHSAGMNSGLTAGTFLPELKMMLTILHLGPSHPG